MFWPGPGVKHVRNIEIITLFGNLISVFSMFRACFCIEHWSMPAVHVQLVGILILKHYAMLRMNFNYK